MPREHVHLVNQVNFKSPTRWRVLNIVEQLARVFNLGARSRIHLNQINKVARDNFLTAITLTTRLRGNASLAIQTLCKNARNRRFTHTTRACKQISMMQTVIIKRIDQRTQNVLLPNHLFKILRSPLTCENLITHGGIIKD